MTGPVTASAYDARMARNTELVRQWEILRDVDAARNGISVPKLAAARGVHQRTIRRDLEALARAGFPLYDDKANGTSMWKLRGRPFRGLDETGMSVTEMCALYLSHAMLRTLGGTPLLDEAERAFAKIERALPAACRGFLDQLPGVLKAKGSGRKKQDDRRVREIVARILDAIVRERRAEMRYAKPASRAASAYVLDPHRIVYAHGGMYLLAFVPAYGEMRTFAVERMETFALTDERFTRRPLPPEPFAHSLGVHSGPPERVVLEFDASVAPYVREREWHASQTLDERPDGGAGMTLDVCVDHALRSWVLGFGASVRVVEPAHLVESVFETALGVRVRYQRHLTGARRHVLPVRAS
jgi:predicted DNA-binding transcriptional regulator YafY